MAGIPEFAMGTLNAKPNKSKFHLKSIAYAAENLELGSLELEVTPVEEYGYLDGELNTQRETFEETGVDAFGNEYQVKIETSNTIKAKWLQWGSNRITPPNIRRGEMVLLYQYANVDEYYWVACGKDDYLRRLETATWAFSNTRDEKTKELNPSNSYFFEVSTHNKHVTLQTNKSDQQKPEPFAYTIQVNTGHGCVVITDDVGNFITLNSKETSITLQNQSGTKVELIKDKINLYSSDSVNIDTKTFNVNAQTTNITAQTNIKGNTDIKGNFSTSGGFTNNGVNVGSSHTHGGVRGGPSRTSTPG